MAHLDNKIEWCINKAKNEGKKHRGLKIITPDIEKANNHINKANHNLKVMLYLIRGNFSDWAVSTSFYSMYHCLLAILAKNGYESRNQQCTFAAVEHLINSKKIDIDIKWLKKIGSFDDKLEEGDIVALREEFQYDIKTIADDKNVRNFSTV